MKLPLVVIVLLVQGAAKDTLQWKEVRFRNEYNSFVITMNGLMESYADNGIWNVRAASKAEKEFAKVVADELWLTTEKIQRK